MGVETMAGKSKIVFAVVIAVTATTCFLVYNSSHFIDGSAGVASISRLFGHYVADDAEMSQEEALYEARSSHVMRQCQARADHYYRNVINEPLKNFLVDKKHHLIFCFVPKNGCSFWKRVIAILDGAKAGKVVFNLSGTAIHTMNQSHGLKGRFFQMYHSLQSSKKVMFVRDPYERLFSGYIDKYFCPCSFDSSSIISKFRVAVVERGKCRSDLSFMEFLQYVTNTQGFPVNAHFNRQYTQCLPCHIQYDYIGKMETFRQDAEFILRSVHVDPSLVLGPEEKFEENSDLNIMNDLAERSFRLCRRRVNTCFSHHNVMLRVWVTLQVRGFLSIHRKFPLSVSEAKRTTLQQFQALVKAAYRQSGDRGVVKRQRQLALQEAYHSVPRSLLAQVQRFVAEDCELFGYDCSIESRFNVSDKPEPVFHLDQLL